MSIRLKVNIEGIPAFIDIDGPFTVTPIYVSKPETQPVAPESMLPNLPKPKSERRHRRVRKVCPVCKRNYNAISRSLYCSDGCRHRAYAEHENSSSKAREWALRIHAGASGVEVQTGE